MTLEKMTAQRDALLAARYRGFRTVEYEGKQTTHARDAEMAAAALADLSDGRVFLGILNLIAGQISPF